MSNTLLTPQVIAREALMLLSNNLVMGALVHRDYSNEFARVGDTVTIRKPATFVARDADTDVGALVTQNVTEQSTSVVMNEHKYVRVAVTSKELTLSLNDFSTQILQPMILPIAQVIDADLAALYKYVPYTFGTAGTTPDELADLAGVRKVMNINKAPNTDRRLVIDPTAEAALLPVMAELLAAKPTQPNPALENAILGRVMGFDTYMSQNIVTHDAPADRAAAIDLEAGYLAGVSAIHLDALTQALTVGDHLTIAGDTTVYTVIVAGTLSGADQDVTLYPALQAAADNDDVVTVVDNFAANLAFHRNAFALVSRPLAAPMSNVRSEVINFNGMGARVVYDWDSGAMSDVVTLDVLYGVKCIYPELAAILLG